MDDPVRVQVMERCHELPGDRLYHLLRQARVDLKNLEKLPLRKLRHHAKIARRLKGVEHLDYVVVAQRFQDVDLLAQPLDVSLPLTGFGDELDRHRLEQRRPFRAFQTWPNDPSPTTSNMRYDPSSLPGAMLIAAETAPPGRATGTSRCLGRRRQFRPRARSVSGSEVVGWGDTRARAPLVQGCGAIHTSYMTRKRPSHQSLSVRVAGWDVAGVCKTESFFSLSSARRLTRASKSLRE